MQLLEKLFRIISKVVPPPEIAVGKAHLLSKLNPDKFYIENVRSILDVSYAAALRICETGVRQGLLDRQIEVVCPDGAVAATAGTEAELPELVRCWQEQDGHLEPEELPTKELKKSIFYRLHEGTDSVPYGQTA